MLYQHTFKKKVKKKKKVIINMYNIIFIKDRLHLTTNNGLGFNMYLQ